MRSWFPSLSTENYYLYWLVYNFRNDKLVVLKFGFGTALGQSWNGYKMGKWACVLLILASSFLRPSPPAHHTHKTGNPWLYIYVDFHLGRAWHGSILSFSHSICIWLCWGFGKIWRWIKHASFPFLVHDPVAWRKSQWTLGWRHLGFWSPFLGIYL